MPRNINRRRATLAFGAALGLLLALALLRAPASSADARVLMTPASGFGGTPVNLSGAGFGRNKNVVIKLGRKRAAKVRSSRSGSFKASLKIPDNASGLIRILSKSRSGRVVNFFRVPTSPSDPEASEIASASGTRLRWAPRRASAATRIGIRGSRFNSGRRVRISFGGTKVSGGRTGSGGRFSARVVVPPLALGGHSVSVRAGRKRLRFRFTVAPDPLIVAAGDIACDPENPSFNGTLGGPVDCHMRQTADLISSLNPAVVLPLGDNQYEAGLFADYQASYDPTWGRFKRISRPVPGNHEYGTPNAAGYFTYFGALAGDPAKGYYSYDIGAWHVIALNSNCTEPNVHCGIGFAQERWLRSVLQTYRNRCVLAYWHHPFFSSGQHGPSPTMRDMFNALYEARADLVLVGHDHIYERFAPQTPDGQFDAATGIREFVVGTGGRDLQTVKRQIKPNSEIRSGDAYGVLSLRLHRDSYDWQFNPEPGHTFRDSGSQLCH